MSADTVLGTVVGVRRHPVKSMLGEELPATVVTDRGVLGDRAYALVDPATGKLVSAKNPRKWLNLFDCQAVLAEEPRPDRPLPPARITLPDGSVVTSTDPDVSGRLSRALGREVTLVSEATEGLAFEYHWPDLEGLMHRDQVTEHPAKTGAFFDGSTLMVLATTTLAQLQAEHPEGQWDVSRFRPNVVVKPSASTELFIENGWVGRTLTIGDEVRLKITEPCMRCVMTTVAQNDLANDLGILKAIVEHNDGNVGVRAEVEAPGRIARGDDVRLV